MYFIDINFSSAMHVYGITAYNNITVKLFDNYRCPVDKNTFSLLVRQFSHCNDFYFQIDITGDTSKELSHEVKACFECKYKYINCKYLFEDLFHIMYMYIYFSNML